MVLPLQVPNSPCYCSESTDSPLKSGFHRQAIGIRRIVLTFHPVLQEHQILRLAHPLEIHPYSGTLLFRRFMVNSMIKPNGQSARRGILPSGTPEPGEARQIQLPDYSSALLQTHRCCGQVQTVGARISRNKLGLELVIIVAQIELLIDKSVMVLISRLRSQASVAGVVKSATDRSE